MKSMMRTRQPDLFKRRVDGVRGRYARQSQSCTEMPASASFGAFHLVFDHGLNEGTALPLSALALKTEHCHLKTRPQAEMQIPRSRNAGESTLRER